MTLSIAAWDEHSGQLGSAISSSSIAVSSRCLHWQSGVGIALSQNITDPRLGPRLLSLLADGVDIEQAMQSVIASSEHINYRQLAAVSQQGDTAIFNGSGLLGCFASSSGRHCVAVGNLLANQSVPDAMIEAFETVTGSFGTRVLQALVAGIDAGGEAGPVHSAGMLIGGAQSFPLAELRIDWDDDPIQKMLAGWEVYEPQIDDYVTRALNPTEAPSYNVPGDP